MMLNTIETTRNYIQLSWNSEYLLSYLMEVNQKLKKAAENPKQEMKSSFEKHHKLLKDYLHEFEKGEFSWEKFVSDESFNLCRGGFRSLTKFRNMTNLNSFDHSTGGELTKRKDFSAYTLLDASFFQQIFPLKLIKTYLSKTNRSFGTVIYDNSLRIQCDLLQIFLVFHLKHDFRFYNKIDGKCYNIIDPITRIELRTKNNKDKALIDKYFNEEFNLKEFVFSLFENFFPNVTWRYIGDEHFAHRISIQITEFMFTLGLWQYDDHERLAQVLLEKSENIQILEKACLHDYDGTLSDNPATIRQMKALFIDINYFMAVTMIHLIFLINDESLKESLSWLKTNKKEFSPQNKNEKWVNSVYKGRELTSIILNILNKILPETELKSYHTNQDVKKCIEIIFMMISTVKYDYYSISNSLVSEKQISFFHCRAASLQELKTEMVDIKENLINLIDDIASGNLFDKELSSNHLVPFSDSVNKAVKYMANWIFDFMSREVTGITPGNILYYKQMICAENGVIKLLLIIVNLLSGNKKFLVSLLMVLRNLISICQDNFITQAQLFSGDSKTAFNDFNKHWPLISSIVNKNIFLSNNSILYVNHEIFDTLFAKYIEIVERVVSDIFEANEDDEQVFSLEMLKNVRMAEKANRNQYERDSQGIVERILSIYTMNTFFCKIMETKDIKSGRKRSYDIIIQKFLNKFMTKYWFGILVDEDFLPEAAPTESSRRDIPPSKNGDPPTKTEDWDRLDSSKTELLNTFQGNIFNEEGASDSHQKDGHPIPGNPIKINENDFDKEGAEADDFFEAIKKNMIKSSKQINFMLLDANLNDLIKIPGKANLTDNEYKTIIFELAASFLKTFNKSTERFVLGKTFRDMNKYLNTEGNYIFYPDYLISFREGLSVSKECLKLMAKFKVFPNNELISQRDKFFTDPELLFFEKKFPRIRNNSHFGGMFYTQLVAPLIGIETIAKWAEHPDQWTKNQTKDLLYEGIFPCVYKYVKAVSSLFFIDKNKNNLDELTGIAKNIDQIYSYLFENQKNISNILQRRFSKPLRAQNFDSSIEKKLERRFDDMEIDEILYQNLYRFRKKSEYILEAIEQVYPEKKKMLVLQFVRPNGLKRTNIYQKFSVKTGLQNFQKSRRNGLSHELLARKKQLKRDQSTLSQKFTILKELSDYVKSEGNMNERYREYLELVSYFNKDKQKWLDKAGTDNLLLSYFEKNPFYMRKFAKFILKVLYEAWDPSITRRFKLVTKDIKPHEKDISDTDSVFLSKNKRFDDPDFVILRFFEESYIFSYIMFINQVVGSLELFRLTLYTMLCKEEEDKYNIINSKSKSMRSKIEYIWGESELPDKKQLIQNREVLSCIYYIYVEFGQFVKFKVFMNSNWEEIWSKFYNLGDLLKNLCSGNSIYFKRWLDSFQPKVNSNPKWRDRQYSIVFGSYIHFESYVNLSISYQLNETRISMKDVPETFDIHIRAMDVMIEFLTGPCKHNQRRLYKYRPDIWVGFVNRVIDDVDSYFYELKGKTLRYIMALMENENAYQIGNGTDETFSDPFAVTKFYASNFVAGKTYRLIYDLLKRLVIATKMKIDPKFKKKLLSKVRQRREKELNKLQEGIKDPKALRSNPKFIRIMRQINLESIHSEFEHPDSMVTQDLLDEVEFNDQEEIMDLYKSESYFYNHHIIKICLNLYSLLQRFSEPSISKSTKLFLDSKTSEIMRHFGSSVDNDDLIDTTDSLRTYRKGKISEDLVFFLFLLKISRKIEISVALPVDTKRLQKLIYFQLTPSTMFLQERSKQRFFDTVDVDNAKGELQSWMEIWFKEMELFHEFKKGNSLMYNLTRDQVLYYLQFLCWIIGVCINISMLNFMSLDNNPVQGDRKLQSEAYEKGIIYFSLGFSVFSLLLFLIWAIFSSPKLYILKKMEHAMKNKFDDIENSFFLKFKIAFKDTYLMSTPAVSFSFHAAFAFLGVFVDPVFHTFHLWLVINLSDTLMYLISSLVEHYDQLLSTLMFAMFVIYSFSSLSANFFSDKFDPNDVNTLDICNSLMSCFMYTMSFGLRNGGGLGDSMEPYDFDSNKFYPKIIFDLTYFIFINVICLNIIFGIIIDTFGEKRVEEDERSK